jgi:hypothetical protein
LRVGTLDVGNVGSEDGGGVRGGGDKGGEEHDYGEGRGGSDEEEMVVARSGKRKLEKHRRVAVGLYRPPGDIGGRRLGWAAWWLNVERKLAGSAVRICQQPTRRNQPAGAV